jgi:long-chain acyl-CoA synthetase
MAEQAFEKNYPPGVRWDAPIVGRTLQALLDASIEKFSSRTALEFRDQPITFTGLGKLVDTSATAFLRAGYGRDTSVALYIGNTPDHPINFFGALKAGARIVHLSPLDGEIALSHKLKDSGARVLVTSNLAMMLPMALKFLEKGLLDRLIVCDDASWGDVRHPVLPLPDDRRIVRYTEFVAGATPPARWPEIKPGDIALLQYTGGTTGLPKGAMLTHGNLTAAVDIFDVWGAPGRAKREGIIERTICVLPLFHIFALTTVLLLSLKHGNVISLHQRFDVEAVMRDIEVKRATGFPGVPTMWIAIAALPDLEKRDLSSLAYVGSGGAPLPVEVAKILASRTGLSLRSGWGMTETCSPGTANPSEGPDKPASIGLPLPSIELDIVSLDDPKKVLPMGEVGEIRIKGPNVTKGYWNKPKETTEAFVGDKFLTGDIGYVDDDGYYYIVDRKKDMIISGGFNVYPQMIEQAIYLHPAVQEVIVIGIPDQYRGEAAKAYVKLRVGAEKFSLEELRDFLTGKIGKHELPAALEFRDDLPKTTVGKLSRHELRVEAEKQVKAGA